MRISNPEADYPPEGNVFCPSHETRNASDKELWEFSVTPNTQLQNTSENGDGRRRDRNVAVGLKPVKPIIDLSSYTLEEARQFLVELGVEVKATTSGQVLIKLANELWACVELDIDARGYGKASLRTDLESVSLFRGQGTPEIIHWNGASFVCGTFSPGTHACQVDWSSDDQFLRELPKRLKKFLGQSADGLPAAFPSVVDESRLAPYFRAADMLPKKGKDVLAFKERLNAFLAETGKLIDVATEVFDEIRFQPPIVAMVGKEAARLCAEANAEMRRVVEAEVRAGWEQEHTELVRRRTAAVASAEAAEAQTKAADIQNRAAIARVSDAKKKLDAVEQSIVSQVDGLRAVLERAPKSQSERIKAIGRHVEKTLGLGRENTLVPSELPPWSCGKHSDAVEVRLDGLRSVLVEAASSWGLEAADLSWFDVLVRAGEAVLLCGPDRDVLLSAYSDAVAGGRIRRMPLDIGIIGADDLWRQPGTGQPTAFAHAWVAARANPDSPVVMVLDEIQGASGWSWLPALTSMLSASDRPKNLLLAMSVGPMPAEGVGPFRAVVEGLPRTSPAATQFAPLSISLARMVGKTEGPSLLRGLAEPKQVEQEEASIFAAKVLRPLSSVHQATRVADAFSSARLSMAFDEAMAFCTDFASFLSGAATENIFMSNASRFDGSFAPRSGNSGSSGVNHV